MPKILQIHGTRINAAEIVAIGEAKIHGGGMQFAGKPVEFTATAKIHLKSGQTIEISDRLANTMAGDETALKLRWDKLVRQLQDIVFPDDQTTFIP